MSQRICSVDGCERPHDSKGLCGTHANRLRRGLPLVRVCATCRDPIRGTARPSSPYCSDECLPQCSEDGCGRRSVTKGLCAACYGDRRAYAKTGKSRGYRWAEEKKCIVCGSTEWDGKRRKVCSGRCQQLFQRYGGAAPAVGECTRCGGVIDLTVRGKGGRKKRNDTKMCHWCKKARHLRHHVSVTEIVNAAGSATCGICSEPVDMTLQHPDIFRASVDHIVPFSRGGTHEMGNLQVAHLYCNFIKSDRENFSI